jgi:uncharacterized protein involved in exopolysaccharide biosynthesis
MSRIIQHRTETPMAPPEEKTETPEPVESLASMVDIGTLWRQRWVIVLTVLATLVLGALYLAFATPVWEAEARALVRFDGSTFDDEYEISTDREFMANQSEIIRSPVVLEPAMRAVYPDSSEESLQLRVAAAFRKLVVIPVIRTDVLKISFRSEQPGEASKFVTAVLDTYRAHVSGTYRQNYTDAVSVAAEREEALRQELAGLRQQYEAQRSRSQMVGQGRDSFSPHLPMVKDVGEQLAQIKTRRLALENSLQPLLGEQPLDDATVTRFVAGVLGLGSTDTRELAEIQQELAAAELLAKELSQTLGTEHPSRKSAEEKVEWWRGRLADKSVQTAATLRGELETLRQSEAQLRGEYQREVNSVRRLDGEMVNEEILLADIRRVTDAHDEASQQLARLQLADREMSAGRTLFRVESLDGAQLREVRVWPQPRPVLGASLIVGLMLGLLAAVAVEHKGTLAKVLSATS